MLNLNFFPTSFSTLLVLIVIFCSAVPSLGLSEADSDSVSLRGTNDLVGMKAKNNAACMDTKAKGFPLKIQLTDSEKWSSEIPVNPKKGKKGKTVDMKFYSQVYNMQNIGTKEICQIDFELSLGNEVEYEIIGYSMIENPVLRKRTDKKKKEENVYFSATLPASYTGTLPTKANIPFSFTLGTKDVDVAPKKLPKVCITSYTFCEDKNIVEPIAITINKNSVNAERVTTSETIEPLQDYKQDYLPIEEKEEYEESVQEHLEEEKKEVNEKTAMDDEDEEDEKVEEEDVDDHEDDSVEDSPDDDGIANYKDDEYEYDRRH